MRKQFRLCLALLACCMAATMVACKDKDTNSKAYTVVFMQNNVELFSKEYQVGQAPAQSDYPEIEGKKGYDTVWESVDFSSAKGQDRIVVEVEYVPKTYTVSYDTDGGAALSATTVVFDAPYTLETPSKTGMTFEYWAYTEESAVHTLYTTGDTWSIDKDITVKAVYSSTVYTVIYDANGGDLIRNETAVRYGQPYFLETPTKDGYVFTGWKKENTAVDISGAAWQYAENVSLVASWEEESAETYTLTFDMPSPMEDVSFDVVKGTPLSDEQAALIPDLTAIEKVGYTITWAANNEPINLMSLLYNITENMTLAPKYVAKTFNVSFYSDGEEVQQGKSLTYDELYNLGDAPTKENLVFDGWYYQGTKVELTGTWQHDFGAENVRLEAKWVVKVSFMQNGKILGEKTYDIGASLTKDNVMPCVNEADDENYWYWPDLKQYANLTENITINALKAEYWTENK